jgi:hypothetical protein
LGYLTEFYCKFNLRNDTPQNIVSFFKEILIERKIYTDNNKCFFTSDDVIKPKIEHPFFYCKHWYKLMLFTDFNEELKSGNFYQKNENWIVEIETDFKNYHDEIENFINFVKPYVYGRKKKQYIGWWRGESDSQRTNIYIER